MNFPLILRILGVLLMTFSLTLLVPVLVSVVAGNRMTRAFLAAYLITLVSGALLYWPNRHVRSELRIRDGFLITALFWIVLSLFGSLPFLIAEHPHLSAANAIFESASGLTTTGANGDHWSRYAALINTLLPSATTMVGRYRHHRYRRCNIAHARYRRIANVPRRNTRTG